MRNFYRQHKTTRERIDNLAQRLTRKAGRKVSSREVLGFAESRKFFPEVISGHRCFPIGVADIIFEEMPLEVAAQVDKPLPTDEAVREAWYTMVAGYFATGRTRLADALNRSDLRITDGNNNKAVKFSVENSAQLTWIKCRLLGEMKDSMAHNLGDSRLLLLPEVGTPRADAPAPANAEGVLPGFPAPAPAVEETRPAPSGRLGSASLETLLAEIARRGYDVTITRHAQTIAIAPNE